MQKDLIGKIEKLKERPAAQFYTDELNSIFGAYAPSYPHCTDNEMFSVWVAIFYLGVLKGQAYEARKRRQKAHRGAKTPQAMS